MVFNSLAFAAFAAAFFPIYFLLKGRARLGFALAASYFFYGWWDWRFLSLILISTGVDYTVGRAMEQARGPAARRRLLVASIAINLGILGTFKYLGFFVESAGELARALGLHPSLPMLEIVLPLGISFYTFQTLSYTIDLYRGATTVERSLLRFATYVALFPQLVAGPIVRARALLPQLARDQALDLARIGRGAELLVWGLFMKLCVADNLAQYVDPRFAEPETFGAASHALALLAFSMQIYGDFAGYSLMAIGLGHAMGLDFGINFNRPYFASGFSDFWSRWHISLSSWFRDYVYVPLGGNRRGPRRTLANLAITMGLAGLWHGAAWGFVLWGLLHGLFLVAERLFQRAAPALAKPSAAGRRLRRVAAAGIVSLAATAAWLPFRAETLADATLIAGRIARLAAPLHNVTLGWTGLAVGGLCAVVLIGVDLASASPQVRSAYLACGHARAAATALVAASVAAFGRLEAAPFIYFVF